MLQEGLKNLDVGFDFDDDNDIILSGEICGGNPFCTSMITIDELRDVIKSGYISVILSKTQPSSSAINTSNAFFFNAFDIISIFSSAFDINKTFAIIIF